MHSEIYQDGIELRASSPAVRDLLQRFRACTSDGFPALFKDFDLTALAEFRDHLTFSVQIDERDFLFSHYGRQLVAITDLDLGGRFLSEVGGWVGTFFIETSRLAVETGRPVFTIHRATLARSVYLWERLVLPVQAKNDRVVLVTLMKPRVLLHEFLTTLLDASPVGILALHVAGDTEEPMRDLVVLAANPPAAALTNRPREAILNQSLRSIFPGISDTALWQHCRTVVTGRKTARCAFEWGAVDAMMHHDVVIAPFAGGLVLALTDTTALRTSMREIEQQRIDLQLANGLLSEEIDCRRALEDELRLLATTDPLTGLCNRRAFEDNMAREFAYSARFGGSISLVIADIDNFKAINDRYGHAFGDRVIMDVARYLRRATRDSIDMVGRLGGEEFGIALHQTGGPEAALVARRIVRGLRELAIEFDGVRVPVTISIGSTEKREGETYEQLVQRADDALYAAKRAGRDQAVDADTAPLALTDFGNRAVTSPARIAAA